MSGANRPAGPATPKSKQLAKQISRDEMEHNLPDALWGQDEEDNHSTSTGQQNRPARHTKNKDKNQSN